jgi:alkanesulfonate monooxygenase SsuD/methylene tetrahydromethanopterin reductase-like flavin-dependent oxidoreductase (luciferase family)
VKVFVEVSHLAATLTRNRFADAIQEIQDCGATGVSVNDHIFATYDGRQRSHSSTATCDPLTTLAVVAGLSDHLAVEAIVVNTAWIHPALVLRQFLQLAQFLGGERVTAGLGAGWSREEFDALGFTMPPFAARMARLHEVLRAARTLFESGIASIEGQHITLRDLPLSPRPATPPMLLVGGGSDRVLAMAGQYADVIDLHGHPGRGKVIGTTMNEARRGDVLRRALTTVDDLVERMELVDHATREAGRAPSSVSVSGSIFYTAFGSRSAVENAEQDLEALSRRSSPARGYVRAPVRRTGHARTAGRARRA